MTCFISYSRADAAHAQAVAEDLERGGLRVWRDQGLRGGESWWERILAKIEGADVFVVVLSESWLGSPACRTELDWARSIGTPVLPVRVGTLGNQHANPLAAQHWVNYEGRTAQAGIELVDQARAWAAKKRPPPEPRPEPPPMPIAWVDGMHRHLDAASLSPSSQTTMLSELRRRLREDDEPAARADAVQVLQRLRKHPEVTWHHATEIDELLRPVAQPSAPLRTVVGVSVGGLGLTGLLSVSRVYPAVGFYTTHAVLAGVGVVLCGLDLRRHRRTAVLGILLCLAGVTGTVIDAIRNGVLF